jgi:putative DNA primase/helicase
MSASKASALDLVRGFEWTDSGNAERLIACHGSSLRYVTTWDKWLWWTGARWIADKGAPYRLAKATARAMREQAALIAEPNACQAAVRFALKSEGKAGIEAAVSLARHDLAVAISHEQLDTDPMLFNVQNGTIDLRLGELREHRREDLCSKVSPVTWNADAECPRFDAFMLEIMCDDANLVAFQRCFLGYCLTGDVREHMLAFWWGAGGNGKSLLALIVLFIMGDYAAKAAPDLLFRSEKSERHPTELADLHGRRLVICNETTRGRAWDEGTVKDVTGGDRIRARRMREDFWEWNPTHKVLVFGQHKPVIRCVDDAMKRRLRLVPFAASFVGREDKTLDAALKAEAPGILRRLVEGCLAWKESGIPGATAVDEATAGYFREEDTLGQFFAAECTFAPEAKITRKEIRERYVRWSDERDERPLGAKAFAAVLRLRGAVERKVKTGAGSPRDGWAGVRLATEAEQVASSTWGAGGSVVRSGLPEVTTSGSSPTVPSHEVHTETARYSSLPHYPDAAHTFSDDIADLGVGADDGGNP